MEFTSKKTEGDACFGSVTAWGNFYASFQLDDALAAQLSTRGILQKIDWWVLCFSQPLDTQGENKQLQY